MSRFRAYQLRGAERDVFWNTHQFVLGRFEEWAIVEWSAALKTTQESERQAVRDAFARSTCADPWRSLWGWLFESWDREPPEDYETRPHHLGDLMGKGDRSRPIITGIVDNVRPYPDVSVRGARFANFKRPKTPTALFDIAFIHVSSPNMMDEAPLRLDTTDAYFLSELAHELEAAIRYGVDIAFRLSGDPEQGLWRLGELARVYPVTHTDGDGHREDPDRYNGGIAPATKLLFIVATHLAAKNAGACRALIERWRADPSLVFVRLWAAMARNPELAPIDVVARFLDGASVEQFWRLHTYPEIAELRAVRFAELPHGTQAVVANRITKLPPRVHWPRQMPKDDVASGRRYWAVRELRRIACAGGELPPRARAWLERALPEFPELQAHVAIDAGFYRGGIEITAYAPEPDEGFDALTGTARLAALEGALSTTRTYHNKTADEAAAWMVLPTSLEKVAADLEAAPNGGAAYRKVWDELGSLAPREANSEVEQAARRDIGSRILRLIEKLPVDALAALIEPLSRWLSVWDAHIKEDATLIPLWLRLWPLAVAKTNEKGEDLFDFDTAFDKAFERSERRYQLDTLNNAAAHLINVFQEVLPELRDVKAPFADAALAAMRDAIFSAPGRAGVVGKSRLLQDFRWLLAADAEWTRSNLVRVMREPSPELPYLWRALSWRTQFAAVTEFGDEMLSAAVNPGFDRDTRKAMAFSVVAHMLNAYWDGETPALDPTRVAQMLRTTDDEVRAHCAHLVSQFVRDVAAKPPVWLRPAIYAAIVYERAAAPVLEHVWPHERSLATQGVANAFADLPAKSGDAFVAVVDAIERFIVPFDAWSMLEFGFYGRDDETPRLELIDEVAKAEAFLKLLDLSIGRVQGAVVPYDLSAALTRIETVAPALGDDHRFRRLAALTRR